VGAFAAGQVVILPFPFSDPSRSKFRPALLLAEFGRGDWIARQITSNPFADSRAVEITDADFADGGLQRLSYPRPGKLFTAHQGLFAGNAGALHVERLVAAIRGGRANHRARLTGLPLRPPHAVFNSEAQRRRGCPPRSITASLIDVGAAKTVMFLNVADRSPHWSVPILLFQ
jgi:mRNA interferase MazF